jgi:hypothetical protein
LNKVILLAFRKQDVLLDVVQDAIERVLRDGGEKVERCLGAGDVHSLDNAPFEYRARQALPGDKGFSPVAVSGGQHVQEKHLGLLSEDAPWPGEKSSNVLGCQVGEAGGRDVRGFVLTGILADPTQFEHATGALWA